MLMIVILCTGLERRENLNCQLFVKDMAGMNDVRLGNTDNRIYSYVVAFQ